MTARTVDGHQWRPPCAVGVPSAFNSAAMWRRLVPAAIGESRFCTSAECREGGSASPVGHDDPVTTARTYTHVVDERELDYAELLV
jgi:hypothetical protein